MGRPAAVASRQKGQRGRDPSPLFLTRPWRSENIARPHVDAADRNPTGCTRRPARSQPASATCGSGDASTAMADAKGELEVTAD
jgi:hypothetical protein